ncbi:hypothetical protein QR680_009994 [Steinernema hermaphroditum]|uniref:Uncharacterized protein n=1 Tax=Steinernema hermaphroditum TaxID=289476 RepID=A0AA39IMC4_9BILA|nr:hypothetical protein QR680_009994 [Steinernema hermaphroditum]
MTLHDASFWTPFPRSTTVAISLTILIGFLFFFLSYLTVIKILMGKAPFKNSLFYWILGNIGIIDVAFIQATSMACMMSLTKEKSFPLMYEVVSAVHAVYGWVLHLFCFMAALKMVLATFRLEFRYSNGIIKFLTLFIWKALMINLHINHAAGIDMIYIFDVINFSVSLPTEKAKHVFRLFVRINSGILMATFLLYGLLVTYFLLQKYGVLRSKQPTDAETMMLCQGIVTYLPGASYFLINFVIDAKVPTASLALSLVMSLLPKAIPLFNLVGLLVVNSTILTEKSPGKVWEEVHCEEHRKRTQYKSDDESVWSHLFIAIHIFVPLVATSYFFPTWTNMGACLKPSYQNLSSDPEVQKNVALLAAVLSRVNFATKVIFVVDRVICLGPLYLWMHFFLNCAYKWLNLKKKKETHVSAAVKMVLLSPFLCLSVTFCYWFAAFLGQSVIENGPIPTYFGNYRDDIFFQLLIGFSVLRIFFTMMPRAIISLCKIASFSLASVVYYAFFGDVRFAPILPETLFLLSWLVTLDMWDPPKQYLKMVTNVLRISTGGLLLVAILHLMKFAHGYDSVLDVHSNNADPALIFKCSAVIWMAAKVWNFFHTLKYHLRYEYGQLVEELLNYVDRPKRHGKLCRLQNSIKNLVKRCGDYDIHRWVVCRLLSDEK